MPARRRPQARSAFINCPFDEAYKKLLDALIFAIHDCGFYVRCALEIENSGQVRYQKLCDLIRDCPYGIQDLSRTQLDPVHGLPRFNMPLELGLFLGAKEFGPRTREPRKVCLVLDAEPHRYQIFCSDLAGVDIKVHHNRPRDLVCAVRDWLQAQVNREAQARQVETERLPEGLAIFGRLRAFLKDLPALCNDRRLNPRRLIFGDYVPLVGEWLWGHDWRSSRRV
jgi:hypothetical protein